MLLALLLAVTADAQAANFLRTCDPKPTAECSAYLAGFVAATYAHEYEASRGIRPVRDGVLITHSLCLPREVRMEDVRVEAVKAVKARRPGVPLYVTLYRSLGQQYPCKGKE